MIYKMKLVLLFVFVSLIFQTTLAQADEKPSVVEEGRVCSEAAFFGVKEKAETRSLLDKVFNKKNYAQFHLCTRYMTGCGTFSNVVKGGIACKESAESGVPEASLYIADLYHNGKNENVISFPVNFQKAEKYYRLYMKQSSTNVDSFVYQKLSELNSTGDFFLKKNMDQAEKYKKLAEEK